MPGAILLEQNPVTGYERYSLEIPEVQLPDLKLIERDVGGFYSASFTWEIADDDLAVDLLNNGPGRSVTYFNAKTNSDWEGFLNKLTVSRETASASASLDRMQNRLHTRYQPLSGGSVTRSTVYDQTESLNRYGIKQGVVNGGQLNANEANQKARVKLAQVAWPSPEIDSLNFLARGSERLRVRFDCLGWWHTLFWQVYNQTVLTGTEAASTFVDRVVTAAGQFVASKDIAPNNTAVSREIDADRRPAELIEAICELGDANLRLWIAGVEWGRRFYYRQAAPATRLA